MRRLAPALAFLAVSTMLCASPAPAQSILTMDGLGKVRLGMTVKAAERALGMRLEVNQTPEISDPWECSYAMPVNAPHGPMAYMLHHGRIVRIEVHDKGVRTEAGIEVGSSESAIRKAYGRRLQVQGHPYGGERDQDMIVDELGGKYSLLFETWGGKVSEFRVGNYDAVRYIEGCV